MKKATAYILLAALALLFLSGCGAKKETPISSSESFQDAIVKSISPTAFSDEEDMTEAQFEEAYLNHMISSMREPSPADKMRSVYAQKVSVNVLHAENGSAEITLTTPCLSAIITEAAAAHTGSDVNTENILNVVTDALASGDYSTESHTLTVSYTEVDGLPVIEETEEYINALYGGLLDLAKEQQEVYETALGEGE